MPQRVASRRLEVGVDVAGFDPGVLHPGDAPGQVVVGGRAERGDPDVLVARGHDGGDQVDRTPLPQGAEHRAVVAVRDLAEHRVRRVRA